VQLVISYSFISFLFHNGVKKHKLQNVHHKTLRKAVLSYEVVKTGRLCGKPWKHQNLNNVCYGMFLCR
jgi:hypothetical protein